MTLLNTINVGGADYGITGAAIIGSCPTPAGSEVKVCSFTDTFQLKAGDLLLIKFTYANTYGDGSTTYPKLQVNGTNYVMRRADGNYLQSGEWGNNATLTFLFDGTDFILPAGSGTGNAGGIPLGTVLAIYSNQVPDGYLPCNGVQFDTAQFAALYALLGDDHTPDLREVTLRGIGHNGTYVFDSTETDPSTGQAGTQNHDEYTLGEFKDDQLQDHKHKLAYGSSGTNTLLARVDKAGDVDTGLVSDGYRAGTVTRGKSVGVNYIIKATSGLPDSQQDYILNQITGMVEDSLSYSETEQATGGTWIDGKPIYRKVVDCGALPNNNLSSIAHNVSNIGKILNLSGYCNYNATYLNIPYAAYNGEIISAYCDATHIRIRTNSDWSVYTAYVIIEYTKTTD